MRLDKVMDEVAECMSQLTKITVFGYPPPRVTGLAGYVAYPATADYHEAYDRGEDQLTDLPFVLVMPRPTDRSTRDQAARWASGDGPDSVTAAAERWDWKSCDDLTFGSCEFDVWDIAGVPYLVLMFTATVSGSGED